MSEPTLWSFITNAGPIVQLVMLTLLFASIASWAIIIQRSRALRELRNQDERFYTRFSSGIDLYDLFSELDQHPTTLQGLSALYHEAYEEFIRYDNPIDAAAKLEKNLQRKLSIKSSRILAKLETQLSLLATIGSTSPYVGLFGTVWGIMSAFRALGSVQQATIAMVAPGISEALIATAVGLFAAIPAVIAYNRFTNEIEAKAEEYENFQEELIYCLENGGRAPEWKMEPASDAI